MTVNTFIGAALLFRQTLGSLHFTVLPHIMNNQVRFRESAFKGAVYHGAFEEFLDFRFVLGLFMEF